MNLINLTPHPINVVNAIGDSIAVYPPSGTVARVSQKDVNTGRYVNGTPIICALFGSTTDLPEPEPNTFYICSFIVCQANKGRNDLISPNTGPTAKRNEQGQIVGVLNFVSHNSEMELFARNNFFEYVEDAKKEIKTLETDVQRLKQMGNDDLAAICERRIKNLREYCEI